MSDERSEDSGGGCGMVLAGFFVLGVIMTFWQLILVAILAIGLIAGAVWAIGRAADRTRERLNCPVCHHWAGSVILTDLGEDRQSRKDDLCRTHRPVHERIRALETEVLPEH